MITTKKTALDLLQCYDSDSSEENEPPTTKQTSRLPLPKNLLNTNKTPCEDDREAHNGRLRSFPHERGNWASYVYVHYETHKGLEELVHMLINRVPLEIQLQRIDSFHVSLTKTLVLKYHWIDAFVNGIKNSVKNVKQFGLYFDTLKIYCNEERTRTFIGLKVTHCYKQLVEIVELLDRFLEEFNCPKFYQHPSFHMSVAWCVGDHEESLNKLLSGFNENLMDTIEKYSDEDWNVNVESLNCKIGNKLYSFPLN